MTKDLLLEIGMEEVPARFVRAAVEQLADKISKWLNSIHVDHKQVEIFGTPRRIAVRIHEVAEKQQDVNEEVKGPSHKIAVDEQGNWSKAALGFAKSQGSDPSQLFIKEVANVQYVHAAKQSIGVATDSLLSEGLTSVISSLNFSKNMRWGSHEMKFVRPIRWLVALFGEAIIPLEMAGIVSGRTTRGHRFLGENVDISSAAVYESSLKAQFVLANIDEREQLITKQIQDLAAEKGWTIAMKPDLLEEVIFLVEYPTVLFGTFDPDFLRIPQQVLITSMREHQRYFPVLDDNGSLLPFFVTVRNGNSVALEQVAKGNEKVLRARLQDARFFYQEDQKMSIESALNRLETIVFHEELGTVGDKVRRIVEISNALAQLLELDRSLSSQVQRAAEICKFDLVSLMVYEFPELQGIMGEDYAHKAGESDVIAKAILEHYQPKFSGDASPSGIIGAIVSIADKMDSIVGCFSIGIIPTGSQDPYALRRQAAGIVQILIDQGLAAKLSDLFTIAIQTHQKAGLLKRGSEEVSKDLMDFFALRVKNVLTERQTRYDIIDAVLAAGFDSLPAVVRKAAALTDYVQTADFKSTLESFNRVGNLAAKASVYEVNVALFQEPAEIELNSAWKATHDSFLEQLANANEADALTTLSKLKAPITAFFDGVMVMAEDEQVKQNRLALLYNIAADLKQVADFSKLNS
ncbi:glycine--tRNA ligase subunit beta [Paenibacillus psychroresistens]|uniref:Glycine--tRNA ligase beta subunit n=1 Tax=Paenibacillus psychroresistens TaxID=1778678 RepID=A0A6B8RJK0_9BACL|nr:glycine--tRNA ligase subunit beta [Paenibacillus psychroresistens]QGQ95733.1 glycine--tRNA ligase subunit beta [Paenibacillus psychroresistens]